MTIVERPDDSPERLSPPTSPASAPYWEATRVPRLDLQWCRACERAIHFPREACPRCLGVELEFRPAAGTGTVYALSEMPKPANTSMAGRAPYVVALVDLDEDVRLLTNLVGEAAGRASIGDRVSVAWEPLGDGRHLPVFVVVEAPTA